MSLKGKTLFITGASRGIGLAIALCAARDGANVAIAAKTDTPHPKLPGTIHTAADEIEKAGGNALPLMVDVREEEAVKSAIDKTATHFGGIDVVVNNASAIQLTPATETDMRRFDLMHQINTRGTFMVSKFAIPYLEKAANPHILMLSPPLDMKEKWFAKHTAYSIAKYGMSLVVLGLAGELRPKGIAVNALWPRTTIATSAIKNLLGGDTIVRMSRTVDILADAACMIFEKPAKTFTGNFLIDDTFLAGEGVTDFDKYRADPTQPLAPDFFVPDDSVPPKAVSLAPLKSYKNTEDIIMATLLVTHPACLNHINPAGHPERPDRLRAIMRVLDGERFKTMIRAEAPLAAVDDVALCHPKDFVEEIRDASPTEGTVRIDADTTMSPGSYEAALRAAGGALYAVDEVFARKVDNAFCAMRPPGHHAETMQPMGFCLFNSAAIAARHAQKKHGIERVAIVDFDVHHGNGTQEIFWSDPTVMYSSTHEMPLYPGTGARAERGEHNTVVNAPLRAGDAGEKFREAFETTILPRLRTFAPELMLISAGFDAHMRDPLANLNLIEEDFGWVTQKLMEIADTSSGGRVVSLLEGGYDLQGLAGSVDAHVTALMHG